MTVESPVSLPTDASGFTPDVVIVGAGTAGLALAHALAERGAAALLLEKTNRIGGTLYLSTGMFSAGGTRRQRERGIDDSPDEHFNDVMRISKGTVNRDLVRLYCDLAPAMVDWLDDNDFAFHPDSPAVLFGHEAYARQRIFWGEDGGRSILSFYERMLQPHFSSGRVRVAFDCQVDELLVEDGRVVGVRAGDREWRAPGVVLTTGGYASSPDLFARFTQGKRLVSAGALSSTGDGLLLAEKAGGQLGGDDFFLPSFGAIEDVGRAPGRIVQSDPDTWDISPRTTPQVRMPWEIWVNQNGQRFCREDDDSVDNRERALLEQPDMRFWVILDEGIVEQSPPLVAGWTWDAFRDLAKEGRLVHQGASVAELADRLEMPADSLQMTVDAYNLAQSSGAPDPLGRLHRPVQIGARPPLYALRLQGFVVRTWAGIRVDTGLRVRRSDGSAIDGLYAVGEALGANTFSGDSFVAGMSVGPGITLARYLAEQLVARVEAVR